ncbi:probable RNA-binding protein EIF1AD [Lytechinus variegatus]|uniref:probable RNA-binding protein EIF1AD n=1 Tax=Lytechinus variegatus TaxID=7654 RepID=UPI001BB0E8A9|nr:probable RNA-binding protein EIF1AD [Lytechinus variegatus]
MSKATKRKHVTREVLEDYILPEENQQILKILGGRGNNLHEAQTSEGDKFLISMPTRFRKNVWIKRGDFVLADPILEGDKVKAEIVAILYPKQIKYIKQEQLWPQGFDTGASEIRNQNPEGTEVEVLTNQLNDASIADRDVEEDNRISDEEEEYSSEDNDDDLFVNTNRPTVTYYYSDSSEEDYEEEEEDDCEGEVQEVTDEDHSADR